VSDSNVTVLGGFDGAYEHLDLQFANSRNGTFSDPLVRQAFLKVVPRQQILDSLVLPLQEDAQLRSSQVFLPGSDGYAEAVKANGSEQYAKVDVAASRALLAKAGVSDPQVCILFDPTNPRRVSEFGLIAKSAAQAGFTVTDCSSPDWRALLGAPGAYDASLYALRPSSLAVTSAAASFRSADIRSIETATNVSYYSNPILDALFDRLESTADPSTQRELLTQVDTLLWSDAYGVPLYQFPSLTAFSTRVANVTSSPLAPNVLWNIWAWKPVTEG
jgi:peptide/nickel transport system substrate-binding protein